MTPHEIRLTIQQISNIPITARCSARGVFDGVVVRYDGVAADETGVEHPLPGRGRCMFTMVMRVNGHGFLANPASRLLATY